MLFLAGEDAANDKRTHKNTNGANHEVNSGEIKGGFGAGEIVKAVIHNEWTDDGCDAHEAGQCALELALVIGLNMAGDHGL